GRVERRGDRAAGVGRLALATDVDDETGRVRDDDVERRLRDGDGGEQRALRLLAEGLGAHRRGGALRVDDVDLDAVAGPLLRERLREVHDRGLRRGVQRVVL